MGFAAESPLEGTRNPANKEDRTDNRSQDDADQDNWMYRHQQRSAYCCHVFEQAQDDIGERLRRYVCGQARR